MSGLDYTKDEMNAALARIASLEAAIEDAIRRANIAGNVSVATLRSALGEAAPTAHEHDWRDHGSRGEGAAPECPVRSAGARRMTPEEQVIRDWLAGQLSESGSPLPPSQRRSQPIPRRQVTAVVATLVEIIDGLLDASEAAPTEPDRCAELEGLLRELVRRANVAGNVSIGTLRDVLAFGNCPECDTPIDSEGVDIAASSGLYRPGGNDGIDTGPDRPTISGSAEDQRDLHLREVPRGERGEGIAQAGEPDPRDDSGEVASRSVVEALRAMVEHADAVRVLHVECDAMSRRK